MTLNRVKLGRVVTFIKYLASLVSLIFLALTLIWNKITFPVKNFAESCTVGVNESMNSIYKKIPIFFFLFLLSLLNIKISRAHD